MFALGGVDEARERTARLFLLADDEGERLGLASSIAPIDTWMEAMGGVSP